MCPTSADTGQKRSRAKHFTAMIDNVIRNRRNLFFPIMIDHESSRQRRNEEEEEEEEEEENNKKRRRQHEHYYNYFMKS